MASLFLRSLPASASAPLLFSSVLLACAFSDAQESAGNNSDPEVTPGRADGIESCTPVTSTAERLAACEVAFPGALLPAERPADAEDLLYYVNRWYSIDPCFPTQPNNLSAFGRYQNPQGVEPGRVGDCGSYDTAFVSVPAPWVVGSARLRATAWNDGFAPLFEAAAQQGHALAVLSGFRSATTQRTTFESWTAAEGGDADRASVYSAQPLHSEHQLGTTADLTYRRADGSTVNPFADPVAFAASPAGVWLTQNAHRFGVVMTYAPDKVEQHQYKPEPWHFRFVGRSTAALLEACDLSTEELLGHRYGARDPLPSFARMDLVEAAVREDGWSPSGCAEPPAMPSAFCEGVGGRGGWCDDGELVQCGSGHVELARTACAEGCCGMPAGTADACAEELAEIPDGVECIGAEPSFCGALPQGWWCDDDALVRCGADDEVVSRNVCDNGCCVMPPGQPDACCE